jgi:predicted esterase
MVRRICSRLLSVVLGSLLLASAALAADSATVSRRVLAGVPAILSVPKVVEKPVIVLWHGLGPPGSEEELMRALPLDDVPAVKVYLGLPLLGARAPAAGAETLAQRQAQDYALRIFEPIVVGAARELPHVLAALRQQKCPGASGKIGLFGFSAGGAAVLVALTGSKIPVSVAITVNAPAGLEPAIDALERATKQPYAWSNAARELAQRTNPVLHAREIATRQPPPAILLVHGAEDTAISPAQSVSLEKTLRPLYAGAEDRLSLVIAPGVSHSWADAPSADQLRRQIADWFNHYL